MELIDTLFFKIHLPIYLFIFFECNYLVNIKINIVNSTMIKFLF